MDGSKSRKSEAAATRKRRSSILKSQRCVRAPLSELEFNVATPDQAKSRRVSFSRRTGVAEFEINEATTAWKNVYEEHNKSLESSANESGLKAAPRRVGHLGARASHFQEDEADVIDTTEPSAPPTARLDELATNTNTLQLFGLDANPGLRELTDNLQVDFSAMAPLPDDLELLRQDLEREPQRDNISEISIDVDFNATHFSLKADDDDMSITDTIRSPAVAATQKTKPDWTADKENIVVNPYIAPPPAEFEDEDILVFDGKKCKFQSKLDLHAENPPKTVLDMTETQVMPVQILQANINKSEMSTDRRLTVVFGDDGDISMTQAVANNVIASNAAQDKENQKTMYFNDMADMSVTQALPADIIQTAPQPKTILYEDDAHISMTEALPARLLAAPEPLAPEPKDRRRTIVYDNADVSMTGVVPGNIQEDRRKTIVYGNDDGNVSITGVLPANIIDEAKMKDQRKTIVFDDKDGHVSMTGVLTGNVIDEVNVPPNIDRRKTIVYDDNNGDVSVTGVVPTNIINEAKKQNADFRSRTVVFGNNDNDLSMTGVATASILDGAKVTQKPSAERRRTIVYNDDDGNVSMTGVLPANIIDETNVQQTTERRKTIVYDNDDGNLSMTGAVPANVIDEVQQMDRRKTVVFGNDDGNLSMTGVAPINIVDGAKEPNEGRRKTIVYENGDDVSVTGVVLVNILDAVTKEPEADRRKTIVYNDNDGNISVTGVVPAYIIDVAKETEPKGERRKTIVYDNEDGDISVTGVVPVNIVEARQMHADRRDTVDDVKVLLVNPERRKTIVYDREDGELSMTGVTPINILDGVNKQTTDNKETEVYANDDRNVPLTVAASELFEDANEHLDEQAAEPCTERRKTVVFGDDDNNVSITGRVPANIIQEANIGQSVNDECRKTIVFENEDGDVSKTGIIPTNIIGEENVIPPSESNQKSVVYDNEGSTVAAAGLLDKEDGDVEIIQPSNTDSRNTVVFEDDDDGNMSVTEVISNNVEEEQSIQASFESRTTVDFEVNDVFMTDSVPNIVPESTNIEVPETPTSFIEGAQTHNNKIDVFDDEEDDKIEMIDAVTIPKLIESFEEEDISMTQDEPQSLKNLGSTTFNKSANQDRTAANKSLADQLLSGIDNPADQTFDKPGVPFSATIDKSQAEQVFATLEKSVAHREQTFNKSVVAPLSTTFNKSSTDVTNIEEKHSATLNKSLANQDITNKSSSGQDQTFNRSLAAHSISMNKILTSNVLVYGATTELEAKTDESNEIAQIVGDVKVEHNDSQVSPKGSLALSKSSAEQLARSRLEAAAVTPPKESILDVLLDMSQASGEELYSKPQSTTLTRPVSTVTELVSTGTELLSTATDIVSIVTDTDSAVTTESFIMVKDGEPETIDNQTLAIEYKKQKHGIVCKLQRRLSELKDTLHIKPKSPKKEKIKTEIQDPCNTPNLDSSKMNSDSDKKLPKPALKSPSSIHTQEKNKSVKIDLASEISDDKEEVECQVDDQMQVDMSLTEEKDEANETKGQANDTKAILDALSDFTDTRRSGDFGPPNPDKIRQSIAPDRKSIVMSREDLLREISMAQVLMKTETAQTELDLDDTQGSSDEQESPPRLSGEVVKTLRFEDDESILESKLLQKPVSCDSPPYRTSSVIPAYEISDPVKELMKDLIKPLADVDQPLFLDPCRSSQANELDSSQIDLIPAKPLLVSPRSCLRKNEQEVAHSVARSEMHVDAEMESKVNKKAEPGPVIVFDHLNPLNNVVLPPLDRAVVHKYNPVGSEHSLTPSIPSLESACCQTEAEAVAVAGAGAGAAVVGLALARATVDRGVAVGLKLGSCLIDRAVATTTVNTLKDCEVNTSIVMKGNREILAQDSSLTLVDDVLPRSPVRVIFKLEEPYSSVMLDSDLSSVQDAPDTGRKRGHAPARGAEVTPKPAIKVQKVSNNMQVSRRPRSQSPAGKDKEIAPPSRGSSVTVAQLYACARSVTSASATDSRCSKDWRPELLHEASSKNLVAEQESGVNVVAKIDVLPFMGTSECEWESRAADVWTFRLLRARLRLMIRLEHRATNTTRVLVRADTPVRLVTVQHVQQEHTEPVAALCLCLAAEAIQRICSRGVARAGAVPALLRRCAAIARVALHWGRCMRQASATLAFSLSEDGRLSLKVANIPLRSIWEVTLRIELAECGAGAPHPRACDLTVTPVVAAWAPAHSELHALAAAVPADWGHVPRTVWKVFKYLKNKRPEDDFLTL